VLRQSSLFIVLLVLGPSIAFAQLSDSPSSSPSTATSASTSAADDPGGQGGQQASSPLAIHVGDSDLLLGGFMDLTGIFRSTNTGNGIGTNFSNFPFTKTPTGTNNVIGNMSEARFSAQNSRITLQADSKVGSANLRGYIEADFLGNTSTNLNVTSNSNGLRMRLYWAQYRQGKFEFLAGQSWSMLVPNRNGISPMPGDLFYSQDVDTNYQMGLTWTRAAQLRFIYHASDTMTAGFALENPEQYVGSAVVLPRAFPAGEVQQGGAAVGSSSPTPNPYPDVMGKVAFDPKTGKTHQHIDAAFVLRGFKTYDPTADLSHSATGFSGSVNAVLDPVQNVHIIATNYWSHGGGRYIANTGTPDFIVNPDFSLSKVNAFSGIYGVEGTVQKTLLYAYYSLLNVNQNTTFDAPPAVPIGYGIPGSQTANHKINETTVGFTQTFFRDPKIGGMQFMFQYSYLKRTPFSVPPGTPTDAKLNMVYINVRYILP
jgi:hypothetical protein